MNNGNGNGLHRHKWTNAQLDYVRVNYDGTMKGKRRLSVELTRMTGEKVSLDSVKYAITLVNVGGRKLENIGNNSKCVRRKWDTEKLERLSSMLSHCTVRDAARRLGMMESGLRAVCNRNKISLRNKDGWYTLTDVAYILGLHPQSVKKLIDDGFLRAKRHHDDGRKISRNGGNMCWEISEDDLRQFIRSYPGELAGRNVDMYTIVDMLAGINPTVFKGNSRG